VQIVDDYQVIIHTKFAAPELIDSLSAKTDLVMESKARWDAGGSETTSSRSSRRSPCSGCTLKPG
jgi:hypothetical protein